MAEPVSDDSHRASSSSDQEHISKSLESVPCKEKGEGHSTADAPLYAGMSTLANEASPTTDSSSTAAGLFSLPPELRNNIYEMVFRPELALLPDFVAEEEEGLTSGHAELLDSTPPSKSLLSTCRQIYEEANKLYKAVCRKYWQETKFLLDFNVCAQWDLHEYLETMSVEDLQHVRHLVLRSGDVHHEESFRAFLLPDRNSWLLKFPRSSSPSFVYRNVRDERSGELVMKCLEEEDVPEEKRATYKEEGWPFESDGEERLTLKEQLMDLFVDVEGGRE